MDEPDVSTLDVPDIKQETLLALNMLLNVCGDDEDQEAEERRYKIRTYIEQIENATPPYTRIELGFRFGAAVKIPYFNRLSQQDQCLICDLGRSFSNEMHEEQRECDMECPNFNDSISRRFAPGESYIIL